MRRSNSQSVGPPDFPGCTKHIHYMSN